LWRRKLQIACAQKGNFNWSHGVPRCIGQFFFGGKLGAEPLALTRHRACSLGNPGGRRCDIYHSATCDILLAGRRRGTWCREIATLSRHAEGAV
jgi:hypothetical protein